MISFHKYTHKAAYMQITHVEMSSQQYYNPDTDTFPITEDIFISPDRGVSGYHYYKQLRQQCYVYGRANVKTLIEIIITLPHDVPENREMEFWQITYDFLNARYAGEQYVVSCAIHRTESDEPHMHYLFCPAVQDDNPRHVQNAKFCCTELISPNDQRTLYEDFQNHLCSSGCPGTVILSPAGDGVARLGP